MNAKRAKELSKIMGQKMGEEKNPFQKGLTCGHCGAELSEYDSDCYACAVKDGRIRN